MKNERKLQIGIIGSNTATSTKNMLEAAEELGRKLIDNGYRIINGGCGGVMEASSKGARTSENYQDGDIIGILPGLDKKDANTYIDIIIPTGINFARNQIIIASSDVVVVIGGGAGTLNEITFAWQLKKSIIALDIGEGWGSKLAGKKLDSRQNVKINRAENINQIIELINKLVNSNE